MALKHSQIIAAKNTNGMNTIEAANFHLHNKNGLYQRYKSAYDKLVSLLDAEKITWAQFNSVYSACGCGMATRRLIELSEQKRPQAKALQAWIDNQTASIIELEKFVYSFDGIGIIKQNNGQRIADKRDHKIATIAGKSVNLHGFLFTEKLLKQKALDFGFYVGITFESLEEAIKAFLTRPNYYVPLKQITWYLSGTETKTIQCVGYGIQQAFTTLTRKERDLITKYCTNVVQK